MIVDLLLGHKAILVSNQGKEYRSHSSGHHVAGP